MPGAFHTPVHSEPIISQLREQIYSRLAVSLATVGTDAHTKGLAEDVEAIRTILDRLVEKEHEKVMLVSRSYGGGPACHVVHGFERSKRLRQGQDGCILCCLLINAVLIPGGETLSSFLGDGLPPWVEIYVS